MYNQIPLHWQNNESLIEFTQDMQNRATESFLYLQLYTSFETLSPLQASNLLFILPSFLKTNTTNSNLSLHPLIAF
jgi:hypothetical protein